MLEHVMEFAVLIIGLGVADLLLSFHKLLGAGHRVEWDWLSPAFASMAILVAFVNWWGAFYWIQFFQVTSIAAFLPVFFFSAIAFLLMAGALPDDVPESGLSLRKFYLDSRFRLWSLMLLLAALNLAGDIVMNGLSVFPKGDWPVLVTAAAALSAMLSSSPWVSGAAIAWTLGFTFWANVMQPVLN